MIELVIEETKESIHMKRMQEVEQSLIRSAARLRRIKSHARNKNADSGRTQRQSTDTQQ